MYQNVYKQWEQSRMEGGNYGRRSRPVKGYKSGTERTLEETEDKGE